MAGPFIEVTEPDSGRLMFVNADLLVCVAPHARSGSFLYFVGDTDRIAIRETPDEVSALLQRAGVTCQRRDGR